VEKVVKAKRIQMNPQVTVIKSIQFFEVSQFPLTIFLTFLNKSLKNKLNLQDPPIVIECFDISHLSGTSMVGSMVQFRNGKPDKNNM
jgi:excinuclease ABC subunit C